MHGVRATDLQATVAPDIFQTDDGCRGIVFWVASFWQETVPPVARLFGPAARWAHPESLRIFSTEFLGHLAWSPPEEFILPAGRVHVRCRFALI